MEDQLDSTDIGTYLGIIAAKLVKEGNSLQALAGIWYEKGNDNINIINTFGREIISLGEQLLASRKRLCQQCLIKEVKIMLDFNNSSPDEAAKERD